MWGRREEEGVGNKRKNVCEGKKGEEKYRGKWDVYEGGYAMIG